METAILPERVKQEEDALLRALAKDEAARRLKEEALAHYDPHVPGRRAHEDMAMVRAISGANRSGKSTWGAVEFAWHMTGEYPDWYPAANKFRRPIKGRIVATDFRNGIGGVIEPKLKEYLPNRAMKNITTQDKIWIKVEILHKDGWTNVFELMSNEQDTRLFEGWDGDLVWFDEPPKRENYIATLRGLMDRGGKVFLTFTPLEQVWLYDEVVLKAGKDNNIGIHTFDIEDNQQNLQKGFVDWFRDQLDEDEKEARLHGKFKFLTGLVFKVFDPHIHVCDDFVPPDDWPRVMALDPHDKYPFAMGWASVDPLNDIWVYDEWPDSPFEKIKSSNFDFKDYAGVIRNKEGRYAIARRFIDSRFANKRYGNSGKTCTEELNTFGLRFEDGEASLERSHYIYSVIYYILLYNILYYIIYYNIYYTITIYYYYIIYTIYTIYYILYIYIIV